MTRRTSVMSAAVLVLALLACKKESPTPVASAAQPTPSATGTGAKPPFEQRLAGSTPLSPTPAEQSLGGKKLRAELCKLPAPFVGPSASSLLKALEIAGDQLIVTDPDGVLHGFKIATAGGCSLSVDPSFGDGGKLKLASKIEHLSKAASGLVLASSGMFDSFAIQNGKKLFDCKASGHLELDTSGMWGIAPWVNATVELVDLGKDSCKSQPWVLQDLSNDAKRKGSFKMVNTSAIIGGKIYVGGIPAEKIDGREPRIVVIYDKAGKELGRFGSVEKGFSVESFGWIHALSGCGPNVCALDSNFHRMSVWSRDGKKFLGSVDLKKLLGVQSAWTSDMAEAKDGALWIAAAQDRLKAKDVAEGLIFRVTGL